MRLLDIRRNEMPALAWAAAWFFCVLAAYYTIRPVRETFASELTHEQRATLFLLTLLVMIVATPLYGLLVSSVTRRWLVPVTYGFFIANLLTFWAFIDTVGKRAGDVLGAQAYAALAAMGWLVSTVSLAMLPITLVLVALCLLLGSAHQRATTTAEGEANGASGT